MVSSSSPSAGQSSSPSLDGAFMSAQQLLDLVKNQEFICALSKNPEMVLPLKLEVSFNQLVDVTLLHGEVGKGSVCDIGTSKKRHIKFKSLNPNKRVKQTTFVAKTPIPNRGGCYNCNSMEHYANMCPKPHSCRYCKKPGHLLSACPKLLNKDMRKLNIVQAPGNTSRGQGISHLILDYIYFVIFLFEFFLI